MNNDIHYIIAIDIFQSKIEFIQKAALTIILPSALPLGDKPSVILPK
jgi:hypothetical protein